MTLPPVAGLANRGFQHLPGHDGTTGKLTSTSFRRPELRFPAPSHPGLLTATVVRHSHPAVIVTNRRDSVGTMNQHRHLDAPRVRLLAAIVLVVISITASALLVITDGIGGNVRCAHHSGASAAPLLLVAAITVAKHKPYRSGQLGVLPRQTPSCCGWPLGR